MKLSQKNRFRTVASPGAWPSWIDACCQYFLLVYKYFLISHCICGLFCSVYSDWFSVPIRDVSIWLKYALPPITHWVCNLKSRVKVQWFVVFPPYWLSSCWWWKFLDLVVLQVNVAAMSDNRPGAHCLPASLL